MDRTDLLGNAGGTYDISHGGKVYRMSRMIHRLQARWELYLRTEHLNMLRELRELLPADLYREEIEAYKQKLREGHFAAEGEHSREAAGTTAGKLELLRLSFTEHHPDLTPEEFTDLLIHKAEEIETGFMALMGPTLERAAALKKRTQKGQET